MRFDQPVPLREIADLIGAELLGNTQARATGINELHKVEPGDLAFVDHPKYYKTCIDSAASFIIINQPAQFPEGKALLIVKEPFEAYLTIVNHYHPFRPSGKAHSDTLQVGEGTVIMPQVYIGHHVRIGRGCLIHPNVTIMDHTVIGNEVVIQAGTVIGSDAFYYNKKTNRDIHYKKMTSCGRVVIGDAVEIGAGCTIDRGVTGDTVIGAGTKIDNLVHIGHDTVVGRNCLFAAQVGIAGATRIEDEVILWGQVGVGKTLTIGKGTIVMGQSGVPSSLPAGKVYMGFPAEEAAQKRREYVWVKRIPELWEKVMGQKS